MVDGHGDVLAGPSLRLSGLVSSGPISCTLRIVSTRLLTLVIPSSPSADEQAFPTARRSI